MLHDFSIRTRISYPHHGHKDNERDSCGGLIFHALSLTLLLNLALIYLNGARNIMLLSQVKIYLSLFQSTTF